MEHHHFQWVNPRFLWAMFQFAMFIKPIGPCPDRAGGVVWGCASWRTTCRQLMATGGERCGSWLTSTAWWWLEHEWKKMTFQKHLGIMDYSCFSWIFMDFNGFFHMLRRIIPTDFHIFRGVGQPPTSLYLAKKTPLVPRVFGASLTKSSWETRNMMFHLIWNIQCEAPAR